MLSRKIRSAIALASLVGIFSSFASASSEAAEKIDPNLDKYFVFISADPFNSVDGSFFKDGLMAGDGLHFQSEILGRTPEEIAIHKDEAIQFFQNRFGVDVNSPSVVFSGFEVTPELNYHALVSSGEEIPREGLSVDDGGWIVIVMDPAGLTLGGEFAGVTVPTGTMLVKGTYKVNRKQSKKSEIISYQSKKPIIPEADGSFMVSCELFSTKYGEGQAIGAALPVMLTDGRMATNVRNVLTFPGFGKTIEALLP